MTTHINAKKEDIAEIVIMPGDPLRARYIATKYLKDYKKISDVRLILGYTGYYKDKKVTIFSSGMGMPSISIYAYELYNYYDVKSIIRLGSCGSYYEGIKVKDVMLAENAYTLSNFAYQYNGEDCHLIPASKELNEKIKKAAESINIPIRIGNINTSDTFFHKYTDTKIQENYCLGVEMESFGLFYIANALKKEASAILTVSDNLITKDKLSSFERERTFNEAVKIVLESL
jgi:purine-nucleoside phosphorylase